MNKRYKIGLLLFISMVIASAIVSPHPVKAQTNSIKVTYWYTENDAEKPGVLKLVDEYNAMGVKVNGKTVVVEATQKGFFNAREDFRTAFVSGNEPNVFRAARDWVPEFGFSGLIAPLESYINDTDKADFLDSAITMATYIDVDGNEHLYAFPQLVDTPALFYNKHLFEQAGIDTSNINFNTSWTWDEFITNAKLLTNKSANQFGYTMAGMFFGAQSIYYGHGARLFYNHTVSMETAAINSTEARNAFKFVKDLIEVHQVTPPWEEQGWGTINNKFAGSGTVAMIQQGPWELKNFLDTSPEFNPSVENAKPYASPDNLGIMQLPHDDQGHQGAPLGGQFIVVSSSTTGDLREASVNFAKFMTSYHAMKEGAIDFYHLPARKSVYNDPDVQAASTWPYVQAFKANVDKATTVPVHHAWAELEGALAKEMDAYLSGDQSLDQMIERTLSIWRETISGESISQLIERPRNTADGFEFTLFIGAVVILALSRKKLKK